MLMADLIFIYLPALIIFLMCMAFAFILSIATSTSKRKFDENAKLDGEYNLSYAKLINIFEFLSRFPLTSKATNQLRETIAGLSLYTDERQRAETGRIAAISYLLCIGLLSIVLILTQANRVISVGCFVLVMAFRRDFVNKRLLRQRLRFMEDLQITITSLKGEYERSLSLHKSLGNCQMEESTRFIMSNVEFVVKSDDPDGQLSYFCYNNPYHVCIRFAHLCYNISKYGATWDERIGADSFITNLDEIQFDLRTDIDFIKQEKKRFHRVEKLPLIGLILSFLGPWFMSMYIPGLRFFYNDGFGFLAGIISVVVIVVGYVAATRLNDQDRTHEDVTRWEIQRFEDERFSNRWNSRVGEFRGPIYKKLIDESLSYLTPAMLHLRTCIFGLVGFVFAIAAIVGYIFVEREAIRNNYQNVPDATMALIAQHHEDYNMVLRIGVLEALEPMDEEAIAQLITDQGWNLTEIEIGLLAAQLHSNQLRIAGVNFSILHLLFALLVMMGSYFVPILLLKRRKKMVELEAKTEVLLLQAVAVQLMHTPLKLKDYLLFFASISRLYTTTHLLNFILQYNNPEAIRESAYRVRDPNYYQLMEKLYSLHSSGKAPNLFRDTAGTRKYLSHQYTMYRQEILDNNLGILKMLLYASLLAPVFLQMVVPLAVFVFEALEQYMTMLPK